MTAFEKEGNHRRAMDVEAARQSGRLVDAQYYVFIAGAVAGCVAALMLAAASVILAWHEHYVKAAVVGGGEAAAIALFGFRRRGTPSKRQE